MNGFINPSILTLESVVLPFPRLLTAISPSFRSKEGIEMVLEMFLLTPQSTHWIDAFVTVRSTLEAQENLELKYRSNGNQHSQVQSSVAHLSSLQESGQAYSDRQSMMVDINSQGRYLELLHGFGSICSHCWDLVGYIVFGRGKGTREPSGLPISTHLFPNRYGTEQAGQVL